MRKSGAAAQTVKGWDMPLAWLIQVHGTYADTKIQTCQPLGGATTKEKAFWAITSAPKV